MLSLQPVSYNQVFRQLGRRPGVSGVGYEVAETVAALLLDTGDTTDAPTDEGEE